MRVLGFLGKERGREENLRERERETKREKERKKKDNNRTQFKSFLPPEITVIYSFF